MKKYYIGLGVIGLLVVGLVIFTIILGAGNKQDDQTERKAREVAQALNNYTNSNGYIPDSLNELDVKDIPSTISFSKKDDSQYEFCMTYNAESSYEEGIDIFSLLFGARVGSASYTGDDTLEFYNSSTIPAQRSLYIDYYHKKGKQCQTVTPPRPSYLRQSYLETNLPASSNNPSATTSIATEHNAQRKIALSKIQEALEAYYRQSGQYPTFANLNDQQWRDTNLNNLDKKILIPPGGSVARISASGTRTTYGYWPRAKDNNSCENSAKDCVKYTLTAMLEDGTLYSRASSGTGLGSDNAITH